MILAAVAGLVWANSPLRLGLETLKTMTFGFPFATFTLEGWVYDFGIPAFFFLVGLELKREFTSGALKNPRALLVPGLAAFFGVALPAATYLLVTAGDGTARSGWPIPTATDVTFSLAVLLLFGKSLPTMARTFLLSFAVIDDLIAIGIITVLFLGSPNPINLAAVIAYSTGFAFLLNFRVNGWLKWAMRSAAAVCAILALYNAVTSGMQASVIGVVLGLLVPAAQTHKLQEILHPWVAALVLPLFALFAVGVNLGGTNVFTHVIFWAVMTRPAAKFAGVFIGGHLGQRLSGEFKELNPSTLARVSVLAGIGFTISLLVAKLTFSLEPALLISAVAATLLATLVSATGGALALVRAHRPKATDRA
jgi:NhaA family Na+:H+ antiporter